MLRRLPILSAFSLALCIAACALWMRSHWMVDRLVTIGWKPMPHAEAVQPLDSTRYPQLNIKRRRFPIKPAVLPYAPGHGWLLSALKRGATVQNSNADKQYVPSWSQQRVRQLPPPLPPMKKRKPLGGMELALFFVAGFLAVTGLMMLTS